MCEQQPISVKTRGHWQIQYIPHLNGAEMAPELHILNIDEENL